MDTPDDFASFLHVSALVALMTLPILGISCWRAIVRSRKVRSVVHIALSDPRRIDRIDLKEARGRRRLFITLRGDQPTMIYGLDDVQTMDLFQTLKDRRGGGTVQHDETVG